jgi:mono/diheme cytochrome c family protein
MRILSVAAGLALLTVACGGEKKPAEQQAAAAPGAAPAAAPAAPAAAGANGAEVYGRICVTCHQADGKGLPGAFPPLVGSTVIVGNPDIPIKIVLHGLQGPVTVAGAQFNSVMAPWGGTLSDDEIAAVLTYERSNFGNSAGAVTAAQVAAVRSATASRTAAWTAKDLGI